ncbi:uncharacterized protein LOC144644577 isoform X4 [Oculina patagonica]
MDSSEKMPPVELPPHTQQQPNTAQPGLQPQLVAQPGYPAQSGHQPQPGYPAQSGYQPQPGYPAHPGQQPPPGYPPQYGYPSPQQPVYPPQPIQQVQQSSTVVNVGMPATQTIVVPANPRPKNYIGLSICTCLFCTWPIGLAAIVFSCMVDSAYDAGDYSGALRNSNIAKWLNVVSIIGGIVLIIVIYATLGVSY